MLQLDVPASLRSRTLARGSAYDNTSAYTDHMLARTAQILRDASDHADVMMIYASDHGESLGEQGEYRRGLPYSFAPKHRNAKHDSVSMSIVQRRRPPRLSVTTIYRTLPGAAEVRNKSYTPAWDLPAQCRHEPIAIDHEGAALIQ